MTPQMNVPAMNMPQPGPRKADPEQVLFSQKALKRELLDEPGAIRFSPARELAACMLLSIDSAEGCWTESLDFLRKSLGADRADGGFACPGDSSYLPGFAECLADVDIPSLRGMVVNNQAAAARRIWSSAHPLAQDLTSNDCIFDQALREYFVSIGTVGKMTTAIACRGLPIGFVCADRMGVTSAWRSTDYDRFESITQDVMAPILLAARRLSKPSSMRPHAGDTTALPRALLNSLSRAEMQVCRLAAQGLSYKEIADRINRSFSTVDHHLRTIRSKLGFRSTSRMVSELGRVDFSAFPD